VSTPSHHSHLSDNLVLLARETALMVATAAGLDDESVRADSLCQGWTRAHVLTHIARNADGLANLVSWAVTGTPREMYDSPEAREADIEAGSGRGARELAADVQDSAIRFASAAAALAGPPEQHEVRMRTGRTVLGGQLPTLRLMEVVFHHVDLDAGYTFADADPGFVDRAISNAVGRMSGKASVPSVTLRADDGDTWSIAGGGPEVTGSHAGLLLWLARGDDRAVSSQAPLPALPSWG
jgi:maleylpyruvate isomerase